MIGIEEDGEKRIRSRIDACIENFDREIVDGRPELLTIPMTEMLEEWKPEPDMELVEEVYRMLFRGWLLGMAHSSRQGGDDYADISMDFGLTFEEAIEFAKGRLSLTPQQFSRLSDDLKLHAFTIGRLAQLDMIGKVKDAYVRQLESSGMSLEDFLRDVGRIDADQAGFAGYYSTVFRTNLQKDYNAGKAYQMMQDPPMYLQFVGIDDERQSEICSVRTGVIRPYTDPWWDDNWPPLHFNCRSTVREIFAEEAEAMGLKVSPLPERVEEDRPGEDEDGNEITIRRNLPSSGFGRRPAIDNAFWGTTVSQQQRVADYMIQDELNDVAGRTICRDFAEAKAGFTNVDVSRGGIRYDDRITKQELETNLEVARPLAETGGYYVEIKANSGPEKNRQWDCILNGIEKAEFKNMKSNSYGTFKKEINKAKQQASTIVIRLRYSGQVATLSNYLADHGAELVDKDGVKEVMAMLGNRFVSLTRNDLRIGNRSIMKEKLSPIYPPRES